MAKETIPKDILDKLNAGIEITGTDVDIRDLTSASDSVEAKQSTASNLKTEIYNPAETALAIANYVYDGSSWVSMAGNSSGAQKTFFEWLAENGTLRAKGWSASNETSTLYTVPANKVFYLVNYGLKVYSTAADGSTAVGALYLLGVVFMNLTVGKQYETAVNSVSFPVPAKLTAGQTLQVYSNNADCSAYGWFSGYEIDA